MKHKEPNLDENKIVEIDYLKAISDMDYFKGEVFPIFRDVEKNTANLIFIVSGISFVCGVSKEAKRDKNEVLLSNGQFVLSIVKDLWEGHTIDIHSMVEGDPHDA